MKKRLKITVGRISYSVTLYSPELKGLINSFNKQFQTYRKEINGKRVTVVKDKVFIAKNEIFKEYYYPNTTLKEFALMVNNYGIDFKDIEIVYKNKPKRYKIDLEFIFKYDLRTYQNKYVKTMTKSLNKNHTFLVDLQTGKGKAIWSETPVKRPYTNSEQWTKVKDLKIGDMVLGNDGKQTKVTGVYPQGERDLYKVTFQDGRFIYADKEHLWEIRSPIFTKRDYKLLEIPSNESKILTTGKIKEYIDKNNSMYIPLVENDYEKDSDLPLHPYLVGYLIGNGCLTTGIITIHTKDDFITDKFLQLLGSDYELGHYSKLGCTFKCKEDVKINYAMLALKEVSLFNKVHHQKFIPDLYKYGSSKQRYQLLQGLMDSDGTVGKEGNCSYGTISRILSDDVVDLVRSLGGMAHALKRLTGHNWTYDVNIRVSDSTKIFSLPRKLEIVKKDNKYLNNLSLAIESIEHIGKREATCIAVDNKSKLYVTKDYIVTHNTTIACKTVSELKYRTALLILPKYIKKWVGDLIEHYDITENDIYVVQGSESLRTLMNMESKDIPKFIIFSNRTMQIYASKWEHSQFIDTYEYDVLPIDLLDKLKISILLVDETHQEFHSIYKTVLLLDPTLLIGLSATLVHNDKKINKLYELLYPKETRLSFLALDKYQIVKAIRYNLPLTKGFKYISAGGYGYSQTRFEKSLLKFNSVLSVFTKMLNSYLQELYIKRRSKGQKCLIFFGSVDMCTLYTKLYNEKYPKLKVSRFVSGDLYDEMINSDIIISTPGSSGTALDIPGLITVLSPVATGSSQLNLQMLGRLRKIEGIDVIYAYFHCAEIEQHTKYHNTKIDLFVDRVKRHDQLMYRPR